MKNSSPGSQESGIVQRLRRSLRHIPLEHPHVLLACSGGKDSVALAALLGELARLGLLTFTIAHIHHGQHNRADDAAEAVESIGRDLGVQAVVRYLKPESIAAHSGVGLEEALRRERYMALANIATEVNADCIALAHHQSDQAETVLLHLLRGSGIDGLAGMSKWEVRPIPWWSDPPEVTTGIWRPLLQENAATVARIALQSGLPIVEDPTNSDTSYRRNALRHEVLPRIEDISPGSTAAIARSGEVISADAVLLAETTALHLSTVRSEGGISRNSLVALSGGWQLRVVRAWLNESGYTDNLSHDRIEAVTGLARRNRGGSRVQIGNGVEVVLHQGVLAIETCQNRHS